MSRAIVWNSCQRCWAQHPNNHKRSIIHQCFFWKSQTTLSFSSKAATATATARTDVSKLVSGLKPNDVEKNDALAAYLAANFPAEYGKPNQDDDDDKEDDMFGTPTMIEEEEEEEVVVVGNDRNIRELFGYTRDPVTEEGTRACRKLRAERLIPGIIYGANPSQGITDGIGSKIFVKTPWNQLQRELDRYNHHFESRVYDLTIYSDDDDDSEGTVHRVVPRDMQRHPIWNKLYAVNYLRYHPGRIIKIPIAYINEEESAAMKRGGFIAAVNRYIPCLVEEGVPIPEQVELECTGLKLKDVVRMDRIIFPDGVKPIKKLTNEFLIGTVFGRSEADS